MFIYCWSNCVCCSCSFERLHLVIMCTHHDHFMKLYTFPLFYIMQLNSVTEGKLLVEKLRVLCWTSLAPYVCWQQVHVPFGVFWPPVSATPGHNFQMMGLHLLLLWKFSRFAGQIFVEESSVVYLDYGYRFNILFSLVVLQRCTSSSSSFWWRIQTLF